MVNLSIQIPQVSGDRRELFILNQHYLQQIKKMLLHTPMAEPLVKCVVSYLNTEPRCPECNAYTATVCQEKNCFHGVHYISKRRDKNQKELLCASLDPSSGSVRSCARCNYARQGCLHCRVKYQDEDTNVRSCQHPSCQHKIHLTCEKPTNWSFLTSGEDAWICPRHDLQAVVPCQACDKYVFADTEESFFNCDGCGLNFHEDCTPSQNIEYDQYCPDCFEEVAPTCEACKSVVTLEDGDGFECIGCQEMFHQQCDHGYMLTSHQRRCCSECWNREFRDQEKQLDWERHEREAHLKDVLQTHGLAFDETEESVQFFVLHGIGIASDVVQILSQKKLYREYCPWKKFLKQAKKQNRCEQNLRVQAEELIKKHLSRFPNYEKEPWRHGISIFKWRASVMLNEKFITPLV